MSRAVRDNFKLTLPVRESSSKNGFAWRLKSAYNRSASRSIHLSQKEKEPKKAVKKKPKKKVTVKIESGTEDRSVQTRQVLKMMRHKT